MYISRRSVDYIENRFMGVIVKRVQAKGATEATSTGRVIGVQWEGSFGGDGGTYRDVSHDTAFELLVRRDNGSVEVWRSWEVVPDHHITSGPTLIDDVLADEITMDRFAALIGCTIEQAQRLISEVETARTEAMRAPETTTQT